MGQRLSLMFNRHEENVQEVDIDNINAYKWPPKTGNYFGSHFIMGGERFDTAQPEAFLFGENSDLNFLGTRPVPFPYPPAQLSEPTRTLRSLVNIRKDSLKLIRCDLHANGAVGATCDADNEIGKNGSCEPDALAAGDGAVSDENVKFTLEFTFDSDVPCNITVLYFAKQDMNNGIVSYVPRDTSMNSETFHYKRAANQVFSQSTHFIEPNKFPEDDWAYDVEKEVVPIVLFCAVDDEDHIGHAHVTYAVLEKTIDGYNIKAIKQKQCVDGLVYILQEFYGIENKEINKAKSGDEETSDNTAECVICMSDIRDTLILPCRHMCLCNGCANSLRYQASNCPICRAPFRALLQLRAIRKKVEKENEALASDDEEEVTVSQKGVPAGYEAISLIEALNGPYSYKASAADPGQRTISRASLRRSKKNKKSKDGKGSKIMIRDKNKDKDLDDGDMKDALKDTGRKDSVNVADKEILSDSAKEKEKSADVDSSIGETVAESADHGSDTVKTLTQDEHNSTRQEEQAIAPQTDKNEVKHTDDCDLSSDDNSDTLAMSAVSQITMLPGTPDNAMDSDDQAR